MSIAAILSIAESVEVNRRRRIGSVMTRNEIMRTTEIPTKNPWKFKVRASSSLRYSLARSVLERIDLLDRNRTEVVTFGNSIGGGIFAYQGDIVTAQDFIDVKFIEFTTVNTGDTAVPEHAIRLNVADVGIAATRYIVRAGDIIQIQGHPHPFSVTQDVVRGSGTTVAVPVHRPNIFSTTPSANTGVNFGAACQFRLVAANMPTYRLVPGGFMAAQGVTGNSRIPESNAYIEWSDDFELVEYMAAA
jgi:hypothetical protein